MVPVSDRSGDSKEPLHSNTHDHKGLPRHQNIFHWVEEVREHVDVHLKVDVQGMIADDNTEEHDVQKSKSQEALIESRLHV